MHPLIFFLPKCQVLLNHPQNIHTLKTNECYDDLLRFISPTHITNTHQIPFHIEWPCGSIRHYIYIVWKKCVYQTYCTTASIFINSYFLALRKYVLTRSTYLLESSESSNSACLLYSSCFNCKLTQEFIYFI